jgi:hypothetical protein
MSCPTLAIEGQVFSTRFEERDPHDTILMRWIDRYWQLQPPRMVLLARRHCGRSREASVAEGKRLMVYLC